MTLSNRATKEANLLSKDVRDAEKNGAVKQRVEELHRFAEKAHYEAAMLQSLSGNKEQAEFHREAARDHHAAGYASITR